MKPNTFQFTENTLEKTNDAAVHLLKKSVKSSAFHLEEILKTFGMSQFMANRFFDGALVPAVESFMELEKDITDSYLKTLFGETHPFTFINEIKNRVTSGCEYNDLVQTLGKKLFGSAVFAGQQILTENQFFKLSYLPAHSQDSQQKTALFHVGGFLPYSDKIFRLLPEANFFDRFLERGIPVYAIELKQESKAMGNLKNLKLSDFLKTIDEMSEIAFTHNKKNKMIIEGYCGLAMQMLAYLAAFPEKADKKFKTAFTMVAPIDARKCKTLAQMLLNIPDNILQIHFALSQWDGGTVKGSHLRAGMDIPIKGFFAKTPLGRFMSGWKNKNYAGIKEINELNDSQRKELAGAYWISPENCDQYPMPVDFVKFSSSLFLQGIDAEGNFPYEFEGNTLSFQSILTRTNINLAGFYGYQDKLVPNSTGTVLKDIFKERYTHIVHPHAGHISYVLSPFSWDKKNPKGFQPNPVDLLMELFNR